MNGRKPKLSLFCVVLLLFGLAGAALGDWDPGDGHKMHYPQLPKEGGWDVSFDPAVRLADDWQCSQTGPVEDIHFWVSWEDDMVGPINGFSVRIWSDDPCGPNGYSEPNELLWERDFDIDDFTVRDMPDDLQGWFNPFTGFWVYPDHISWQQINITDINEPLIQQEGEIYWLEIDMWGAIFCGWKESGSPQFRDDAVGWWSSQWNELIDPEIYESMDLAFVITTEDEEPNLPTVKWVQNPDLGQTGIDVDASRDLMGTGPWLDQLLADDFPCTRSGPITDIHIWGSWYHDELPYGEPNNVSFTLSIHADIPVGDPNNPFDYSIPGEILWMQEFYTGDYNVTVEANNLMEGYYVPCEPYYEPFADSVCWRYDFYIDPYEAFMQEGDPCNPVVYWLDVQALTDEMANPGRFGWKTSLEHWNDDAVWAVGDEFGHDPWQELRYPLGHQYEGISIDLAFAITTTEAEEPNYTPKPAVPHLKWSQPPVEINPTWGIPTYCGWDEVSCREWITDEYFSCWDCPTQCYGDTDCDTDVDADDLVRMFAANPSTYGDPNYDHCCDLDRNFYVDTHDQDILTSWLGMIIIPSDCPAEGDIPDPQSWRVVADDFRCLGTMPVTSIHWWGSYVEWDGNEPPLLEPIAWRIGFWSNIRDPDPCDPLTFSYPRHLLWQIEVPSDRVDVDNVGQDYFPEVQFSDTCFQYYVDLTEEEYFWQNEFEPNTMDKVFWLSIAAVYPEDYVPDVHVWGWKTRPWHWMDDAVTFQLDSDPEPGMPPLNPGFNFITPLERYIGEVMESYDVAFELDTDPNYIKWEQDFNGIRNWEHYEDERSMDYAQGPENLRGVADDWQCVRRTPVTAIVWWGSYIGCGYEACSYGPFMPLPVPPDFFVLTMWSDVPAGSDPCYPFSHPNEPVWEYWAYDYDEVLVGYDKHPHGEPNEPVFRYSVRLPEEEWFKQRDVNSIFWLSVLAVYEVNTPNYDWGWTNHKHVFNDNAVAIYIDPDSGELFWEELYDQMGMSADMSFMLFTDPGECVNCADYNIDYIINFFDYADFADDWLWVGPAGGYNNSDLDCDGDVDWYDVKIFTDQWLSSCP